LTGFAVLGDESYVYEISSYGNLREVVLRSRYCEKFFHVDLLKGYGKGPIEFARERPVREIRRLGVVSGKGRSRKVIGASPQGSDGGPT